MKVNSKLWLILGSSMFVLQLHSMQRFSSLRPLFSTGLKNSAIPGQFKYSQVPNTGYFAQSLSSIPALKGMPNLNQLGLSRGLSTGFKGRPGQAAYSTSASLLNRVRGTAAEGKNSFLTALYRVFASKQTNDPLSLLTNFRQALAGANHHKGAVVVPSELLAKINSLPPDINKEIAYHSDDLILEYQEKLADLKKEPTSWATSHQLTETTQSLEQLRALKKALLNK